MRRHLRTHVVVTAYEQGWSNLSNGNLLAAAEAAGYDLLITTDQNLRYQQNLRERHIAIVVLLSTSWPRIRLRLGAISEIVLSIAVGDYVEVVI